MPYSRPASSPGRLAGHGVSGSIPASTGPTFARLPEHADPDALVSVRPRNSEACFRVVRMTTPSPSAFDPRAFEGTAEYYAVGRPPYSGQLADTMAPCSCRVARWPSSRTTSMTPAHGPPVRGT